MGTYFYLQTIGFLLVIEITHTHPQQEQQEQEQQKPYRNLFSIYYHNTWKTEMICSMSWVDWKDERDVFVVGGAGRKVG